MAYKIPMSYRFRPAGNNCITRRLDKRACYARNEELVSVEIFSGRKKIKSQKENLLERKRKIK